MQSSLENPRKVQWNDIAEIIKHLLNTFLGAANMIPFLHSSWNSLGAKTEAPCVYVRWKIRAVLSHAQEALRPMLRHRLHLPGFCTIGFPICVERLRPDDHDDIERRLISTLPELEERHMDLWIHKFGMGALRPVEVIFAINAWPRSRRTLGARLGQFFLEATARFYLSPPNGNLTRSPQMPSLAITFKYHDFPGIVWAGAIAQRIRDGEDHEELHRPAPLNHCKHILPNNKA